MTGTLLTSLGLNPTRVLTIAAALRPERALLLTSEHTEHLVGPLQEAADEVGVATTVTAVPVDPYRVMATLDRLRHVVATAASGSGAALDVVLAGGTKPMLAAQAVVADEVAGATLWSWDEPVGVLRRRDGGLVPTPQPAVNLAPRTVARLHAGLDVAATRPPSGEETQPRSLRRLQHLLTGSSRRRDVSDDATAFERGVAVLLRSVLPAAFDVYGSTTVTLRDPNVPTQPAREPGPRGVDTRLRTFEVDALVVRGAQTWTVEAKYTSDKPYALRTAAAELAVRARHVGGDLGHSLLVFRNDDVAERMVAAADPFRVGRLHAVARRDLTEAVDWVLGGRPVAHPPAMVELFA